MNKQSGSLSLITKVLLSLSLLVLFVWVIPTVIGYYKNIDKLESRNNELQKISTTHNINSKVKRFNEEEFKKETASLFENVLVESDDNNGYHLTLHVAKNKMKAFNSFLETLSLRYLVKVKNNEIQLLEKDQIIEVKLNLKNL